MSIVEKLLAIQKAVPAVGKMGTLNDGNEAFDYRKADDVINAIHPLLVEHGILIIPHVTKCQMSLPTMNNRDMVGCKVTVKYYFDDGITPVPMFIKIKAYGMDVGGFAVAKAMTSAYKMLLCQLFSIPFARAGGGEGAEPEKAEWTVEVDLESGNKTQTHARPLALSLAKNSFHAYYNRFALSGDEAQRFQDEANIITGRKPATRFLSWYWNQDEIDLCINAWDNATVPILVPAQEAIEKATEKATNETTQKAAETQEAKEPVRTKRKYTRRPKPAAEAAEAGKADSPGPDPAA